MTLPAEDPRLSAYVLGELGTDDTAAVARAAGNDPVLQAEIAEIRALQHFLTDRLELPADKLHPHQRDNIRRSARDADRAGTITSFTSLRPWFIPVATAAVITLAAFILIRPPAEQPAPIAVDAPAAAIIAPITAPPIHPPPAVLPPAVPQGSVAAADFPTLALPILTTKSDLESLAKFIRFDQQLPPPAAVRLEGILNNFPLRLNGVAAISRSAANTWHPDNRGSGMTAHVATLTTEMIACPWKPSATLLFISLRGNARSACDVRISYHANPGSVAHYRLLGFTPADGPTTPTLPTELPADSTITHAIEIESSQPGGDLGTLEWFTGDQPAPSISLAHKRDAEPSDDARFAALVCTYAQWLTGEQAGVIHPEIVSALAREIASANLPAERAEFLKLIDESLDLGRP